MSDEHGRDAHDLMRSDDDGMYERPSVKTMQDAIENLVDQTMASLHEAGFDVYGHKNRFTRVADEREEFGFAVGDKARVIHGNSPHFMEVGPVKALRMKEDKSDTGAVTRTKVIGVQLRDESFPRFFYREELEPVYVPNEQEAQAEGVAFEEPTSEDMDAVDTIDAFADPEGYAEALRKNPAQQVIDQAYAEQGRRLEFRLGKDERLPIFYDKEQERLYQAGEEVPFAVLLPEDVEYLNDGDAASRELFDDTFNLLAEHHMETVTGLIAESFARMASKMLAPLLLREHNHNLLINSGLSWRDQESFERLERLIDRMFRSMQGRVEAELRSDIAQRNGELRNFLSQRIRETQ